MWISINKKWFEDNKEEFEEEAKDNGLNENYLINLDGYVDVENNYDKQLTINERSNEIHASLNKDFTLEDVDVLLNMLQDFKKDIEQKRSKLEKVLLALD